MSMIENGGYRPPVANEENPAPAAPLAETVAAPVDNKTKAKWWSRIFNRKSAFRAGVVTAAAVGGAAGMARGAEAATPDQQQAVESANRTTVSQVEYAQSPVAAADEALKNMGVTIDEAPVAAPTANEAETTANPVPETTPVAETVTTTAETTTVTNPLEGQIATEYAEATQEVNVTADQRNLDYLGLEKNADGSITLDRPVVAHNEYRDNKGIAWSFLEKIASNNVSVDLHHPTLWKFTTTGDNASIDFFITRDPNTQGEGWKTYKHWEGDDNIAADPYDMTISEESRGKADAGVALYVEGPVGTQALVSFYSKDGKLLGSQEVAITPGVHTGGGDTALASIDRLIHVNGENQLQWGAEKPVAETEGESSPVNTAIAIGRDFEGGVRVTATDLPTGEELNFWLGTATNPEFKNPAMG